MTSSYNPSIGGSPVDRSPSVSSERVSQEGSSYSTCMSSSIGDSTPKTTIFDNLKSLGIGRVLSNMGSYFSKFFGGGSKSYDLSSCSFKTGNDNERGTVVDFLFYPSKSSEDNIPSRSIAQKMTNNIVQMSKFFLGFMAFGGDKGESVSGQTKSSDHTFGEMTENIISCGPIKGVRNRRIPSGTKLV